MMKYTQDDELNRKIAALHPEDDIVYIGDEKCQTLTLERAKRLTWRDTLYYKHGNNADGTPARYRVNGTPQTWKRSPERVRVPVKRGLYEYAQLYEHDLENFWVATEA